MGVQLVCVVQAAPSTSLAHSHNECAGEVVRHVTHCETGGSIHCHRIVHCGSDCKAGDILALCCRRCQRTPITLAAVRHTRDAHGEVAANMAWSCQRSKVSLKTKHSTFIHVQCYRSYSSIHAQGGRAVHQASVPATVACHSIYSIRIDRLHAVQSCMCVLPLYASRYALIGPCKE